MTFPTNSVTNGFGIYMAHPKKVKDMIKVVSIVWEDSRQLLGWKHIDEVEEDVCICHSIGQLIKK